MKKVNMQVEEKKQANLPSIFYYKVMKIYILVSEGNF